MKHGMMIHKGFDNNDYLAVIADESSLKIEGGGDPVISVKGHFTVKEAVGNILMMGIRYSWDGLKPRIAMSAGSDYYECYDKVAKNNGYLSFNPGRLVFTGSDPERRTMYVFNKYKFESFMYDVLTAFPDLQGMVKWAVEVKED